MNFPRNYLSFCPWSFPNTNFENHQPYSSSYIDEIWHCTCVSLRRTLTPTSRKISPNMSSVNIRKNDFLYLTDADAIQLSVCFTGLFNIHSNVFQARSSVFQTSFILCGSLTMDSVNAEGIWELHLNPLYSLVSFFIISLVGKLNFPLNTQLYSLCDLHYSLMLIISSIVH